MNLSKNGSTSRRISHPMVGSEPRFEIVDVTPEMAERWLTQNTKGNRSVSMYTVAKYATDMKAGRWEVTHQGIAFNKTGELVDGQHRLHAIIAAGLPVQMVVSTGLSVEYNSALDQGKARSARDLLGWEFRKVAAVRGLVFCETHSFNQKRAVSVGEITAVYERHRESVDAIWGAFTTRLTGGVLTALMWAYPLNPDEILSLGVQIRDGELLERDDPAFALRRWLERNRRSMTAEVMLATCNVIKSALLHDKLGSVYVGETGYRYLCTKRRVMGLPNTPSHEDVPAYSAGPSQRADQRRGAARERDERARSRDD